MKSTTAIDSGGGLVRQAPASITSGRRTRAACLAIAYVLVALFLVSIPRYYHRGYGFTALIGFPQGHDYEAPAVRGVPHYDYPAWASYDGQFYAQRALDPLLRDPMTDRAMDLAPFRARRILFSWTAYLAGLGRPAWILEAYALQNVVAWLLLALALAWWMPPSSPRGLAAWAACLFSHGLLWSVRFSLLDGPSLLLTALAVKLSETGHAVASAALVGVNGLGRETNVLGAVAQPLPRTWRGWLRLAAMAALVALPILIWEDYLRSIYRSTIFAGADGPLTRPGAALAFTAARVWGHVRSTGLFSRAGLDACIVLPLVVQAAYLITRPRLDSSWWRVGVAYVVLMLLLDRTLWDPSTAAVSRVLLPMTTGFNILLVQDAPRWRFWPWFLAGNLHVIPGFGVI
jgi:hypothetical protein